VLQASNGQSPLVSATGHSPDEDRTEQVSTPGSGASVELSVQGEPGKPKRTRKSTEKKDEPTKAQIEAVYAVFDELFRDTLETPDPDFSCTRTKTSTEAIKELIKRKATPARLRAVFKDMWNEQNEDGEYWWRKRGRMTIIGEAAMDRLMRGMIPVKMTGNSYRLEEEN
jgi:hypothetical protein